jgi:hypothetical protein
MPARRTPSGRDRTDAVAWISLHATTDFLAARAVPGIEEAGGGYRRTLALAHGPAVIELPDRVVAADPRDAEAARAALQRLDAVRGSERPPLYGDGRAGERVVAALHRMVP